MENIEESGSPSWGASFFQTTEDVARAVAAAAAAVRSPRPSVVYSSKDDNGSQLQKFQRQVTRLMKGFSSPPEVKSGAYNPEILTSQKRQWARFQLQSLDHRVWKEPSRLFESMVVVGLHPNCDIQALQRLYFSRKLDGPGRFRSALGGQSQSRVEPNLEPQVLFVYPPEKPLPLKYKDLLSFCFPAGVEVHAVERTPSMSELNEILLGQEHLKQNDLSFVFRLQVADNSTLYGCCVLVEEMVQKPSGLLSMISDGQHTSLGISRQILTTRRCYCILSRIPFFDLHFGVLHSIFTEERLERLTKQVGDLDFDSLVIDDEEEILEENPPSILEETAKYVLNGTVESPQPSTADSVISGTVGDKSQLEYRVAEGDVLPKKDESDNKACMVDNDIDFANKEFIFGRQVPKDFDNSTDDNKQLVEKGVPNAVLPLLRYHQCESSESSSSFQDSPSEDRHFRSDFDETETEEASFSGQDDSSQHSDIVEWAKANNRGSLQILCEYYQLKCPSRGSTIKFHPLDHLHPLEYYRPDEALLHVAGSTIDLKSCRTSLELAEVLTLFAGALLEKQIVVVCSNLGILSACILSIIPLIRPYQWQSLLMPVLPNDMLDFLDAPVPYIVGVKNKTSEVQSKLTNAILVDANKNQVKSPTLPQLPQQKELYSCLSPYHAKLVGESYLARKRPVYECTDVQVEAAKSFLGVLRSYLDSLCSNLRSHTITNVQSNDDKVSLLLKESFIESFPSRDRPFMKLFLDTQLFSVHTDFVLSFFQKE
ncbi:hypothetical protein AABB24_032800 [Solanum stoloniferum]|uniref:UDENN domain-containing protein n=1 Tax=Solanum stoloniferum TaxID=62892 RepID=A0ABD2RNE5_9SOLN